MYLLPIPFNSVPKNETTSPAKGSLEGGLEEALGLILLSDLDAQISGISEEMRKTLEDKLVLRQQMANYQQWLDREEVLSPLGGPTVELNPEEYQTLIQDPTFTGKIISTRDGAGFLVNKSTLQETLYRTQDRLASINTTSEMTFIRVQSLTDQRKNALAMLSNLLASKNESLMGIIRNLKN